MRRSEFLRCVPVALWGIACGESASNGGKGATGGNGSGENASGGAAESSGGAASSTGGTEMPPATGGQSASLTGGNANTGGTASGGTTVTSGGTTVTSGGTTVTSGGTGTAGGDAAGAAGAPATLTCPADVGASAGADDFSMNSETGQRDAHVLLMTRGDIVRRVMNYKTSGNADHQHEFEFTDEQLVALLAGEGVVVETDGPPLNASSGHTHTVRVHACKA